MASRENQGLQAALILFVLITVILAIATYVYFRKSEELAAEADSAHQQIQQANAARDTALSENQKLKEMLGYDIAEKLAVIEKDFNENMAKYGADYPDTDPKNYRTLPEYLYTAAMAKHATTTEAEAREQAALAAKQAAEERAAAETAAADQKFQTAVTTYEGERNAFNQERARLEAESAKVANVLKTKDQEITAVKTQATQAQEGFSARIKALQDTNASLTNQRREREQANFEAAHGRITFVNPAERIVWIDLGLADGLQRHTTFSVYDQRVNEYSPENVKGQIEVTKVIDQHRAEARILGDSNSNPIVQGDLIYTPAWRPGMFLHFAVAGFIDINGDGQEDMELLRNIIQANGGVIDAEVNVNTRYLITGERPDDRAGVEALAAFGQKYDRAAALGVELMQLSRFLALMGYKVGARTVRLGGGGSASPQAPAAQPRAVPGAGANPAAPGANPAAPGANPAAPGFRRRSAF